jgi:EF-P beta-lysylation protein EpmB
VDALLQHLGLRREQAPYAITDEPSLPLKVPLDFASRMRPDWHDPLLLQVLPRDEEHRATPGFLGDAVGDTKAQVAPGLLHKYAGRVLMLASSCCAVHCRYCLRRSFPLCDVPHTIDAWEPALRYIAAHADIAEVILSGGDPLMLDNALLGALVDRLLAIPHVRTLRFHTRVPVVAPERVNSTLTALMADCASRKNLVVVVHVNHGDELGGDCSRALTVLRAAGAILLNQAVLLAGINNSAETLAELSVRLSDHGVLPYYLHQLDRVAGAAHFEVSEDEGRRVMCEMRTRLPGYMIPRYVREVAGATSKLPL